MQTYLALALSNKAIAHKANNWLCYPWQQKLQSSVQVA